jgi:hypothetical protein
VLSLSSGGWFCTWDIKKLVSVNLNVGGIDLEDSQL